MYTIKLILLIVVIGILTGCGAFQQKADTAEQLGAMVLNPEKRHVEYRRENGQMSFRDMRCTGSLCPEELGEEQTE